MREIRDKLGADDAVKSQMLAYYKKVNDANKLEFADRKPKPPREGRGGLRRASTRAPTATRSREGLGQDRARARVRDAHEAVQGVQPRLRQLPRHRLRPARRQHRHARRQSEERAVRGLPRPRLAARGEAREGEDARRRSPSADVCLACHHPPHVHTFDAKAKMAEDPRARARQTEVTRSTLRTCRRTTQVKGVCGAARAFPVATSGTIAKSRCRTTKTARFAVSREIRPHRAVALEIPCFVPTCPSARRWRSALRPRRALPPATNEQAALVRGA